MIWLHGKPGSGKTVLSSTIINQIRQENPSSDKVAVVYFYFDFNDAEKQKPVNMIRSLVSQLNEQCSESHEILRPLFSSCNNGGTQPGVEKLVDVFQDIVQGLDESFIILDALDECPERERPGLFETIKRIHGFDLPQLHMLLTSRSLTDIEEILVPLTKPQNRARIDSAIVDRDISAYVDEQLRCDVGLKRWRKVPQVQEEIKENLMKKADGM